MKMSHRRGWGSGRRSAWGRGAKGDRGLRPLAAALEQEGFADPDPGRLIEGFTRHLMVMLDRRREDGFDAVAKSYLSRLTLVNGLAPASGLWPASGLCRDIDQQGDLLLRRSA